ncbi:MAG: PRC-barrel domain-containing protein [Bacillota bacterium]
MKKTQEILGLPIISISDGIEVGRVKNVIINAEKGAIDYVVVDSGIQILSAKIIPTDNVLGIGEYALTIENEEAINELSKIPAAIDLLQKNIQVKGTKVLTKKGRLIGEIGDIYVDEDENCKIVGLEYIADITAKKIRIIPRDSVITFGKNLVVVKENVESTLLDKASDLNFERNSSETEKKNLMGFEKPNNIVSNDIISRADRIIADEGNAFFKEAEASTLDNTIESIKESEPNAEFSVLKEENYVSLDEDLGGEVVEQSFEASDDKTFDAAELVQKAVEEVSDNGMDFKDSKPATSELSRSSSAPQAQSSASSLFEQRQKQYLNGRKSTKTIVSNSGSVIINEGNLITDEIIELAKENGKLIELVMNNKA